MSDAVKPQMHGRDHRPGGSDPIPGLTSSEDGIWAYIANEAGVTQSAGNIDQASSWDEAFISPRASSEGWITTPPINNQCSLFISEVEDGGFWLVETRLQVAFDTSPVPGDWIILGNLMGAGGAINVEDVHIAQPADKIEQWFNDETINNPVTRLVANTESNYVVTAEYANDCSVSGTDITIIQLEIVVCRIAPGHPAQTFP